MASVATARAAALETVLAASAAEARAPVQTVLAAAVEPKLARHRLCHKGMRQ